MFGWICGIEGWRTVVAGGWHGVMVEGKKKMKKKMMMMVRSDTYSTSALVWIDTCL